MAIGFKKKLIIFAAIGAFSGYFFVHPFIMLSSYFMDLGSHPVPGTAYQSIYTNILRSYSISMLPWSLSFAAFAAVFGLFYGHIKQAAEEKAELIIELQDALAEVKTLSGLIPICSWCKKIRDDNGYWKQIESYIRDHSEAEFSHGICPECATEKRSELYRNKS